MPEHANDRDLGDRDLGDGDLGDRDPGARTPGDRGRGEQPMRPAEEAAFAARLSALGDRLGRAAKRQGLRQGPAASQDGDAGDGNGGEVVGDRALAGRGMALGMRLAGELVAAVVVGGGLGVALDKWLGTWPWLFLVFFLLGFAAGVLNVARGYATLARQIAAASARRTAGDDG